MDNREPWVLTAAQGSLRQNPKLSKAHPWVRSEGQAQGKGTTLARILWGSPTGEKRHPSGASDILGGLSQGDRGQGSPARAWNCFSPVTGSCHPTVSSHQPPATHLCICLVLGVAGMGTAEL